MKKKIELLVLLSFLAFSQSIFGDSKEIKLLKGKVKVINKTEKVIGQLIKPEKKLNLPYKYYITIQRSDGKIQAFPFKSKNINPKLMIKNRYYYMNVYPTTEEVTIGEKTQTIHVMNLKSAKLITMRELGITPPREDGVQESNLISRNKKNNIKRGPDFRINDKVTNSLIFAAGATLLYSILAN